MNIVVVSDDVLAPVNNGGRLLINSEIEALRKIGTVTVLELSRRDRGELEANSQARHQQKRISLLRASVAAPFTPYQFASREPDPLTLSNLSAKVNPDVIIAHHEWSMPAAIWLRKATKGRIPKLILRSHNNEREFFYSLFRHATGLRKLYFFLELQRMTSKLMSGMAQAADEVWVVSPSDGAAYPTSTLVRYMPPVLARRLTQNGHDSCPNEAHIVFVGALDMPHTADGLLWFLESVWPAVRREIPQAHLDVAGRRASRSMRRILDSTPGVKHHGEVSDATDLILRSRVFINPVFAGSGVNMKVGLPAMMMRPIVTTSVGSRGLGELGKTFRIANSSTLFAKACVDLLLDFGRWRASGSATHSALREFTLEAVTERMRKALFELP